MKTANCFLKLDRVGSCVPVIGLTPAEAQFLASEHNGNAGGDPILDLVPTGDVTRSDEDEFLRLRMKYAEHKLKAMFPGASPVLPKEFAPAIKVGLGFELPASKMMVESGGKMSAETDKK